MKKCILTVYINRKMCIFIINRNLIMEFDPYTGVPKSSILDVRNVSYKPSQLLGWGHWWILGGIRWILYGLY